MFFILSKTLNYLAMPLVMVCILFLIGLFIRSPRWKKKLLLLSIVLLFFFSNDFIANEFARLWEIPATKFDAIHEQYEWAILLTGVTRSDLKPDDRVYFQRGADRVVHTLYLYQKGLIKKILVSGGDGNLIDARRKEADEIKEALMLMGVPEADILTESQSRNTHESAVAVKKMVEDQNLKGPFMLVTSAFHMRRSTACFNKVGLPTTAFSTDFITHKRKFTPDTLLVPRIDAITIWTILFKEFAGMATYWLTGRI